MKVIFLLFSLTIPTMAVAAEEAVRRPQWWEIVAGILAIPAAIIGIIYSLILIRKTRVEVRKTELEIKEKERNLRESTSTSPDIIQTLIPPLFEAKNIQLLILRFVLLWVTINLWKLADHVFIFLITSVFLGIQQLTSMSLEEKKWVVMPFYLIMNLPKAGELIILLGLGLPLFRDVSTILGIDLRSIIFFWRRNSK